MKKFSIPSSAPGITLTSTDKRSHAMSSSKRSALISTFATLLCLTVVTLPHAASAFDAAADFSSTSNPNGAWDYGWSTSLGGTFNLDTTNTASFHGLGISGWLVNTPGTDYAPYVQHNGTANPITYVNTTWQAGQLAINPAVGTYGIVRWIAPSSGQFSIAATFSGLSSAPGGDSVDVHVLLDGISLFNSAVFGSPSPLSYSGTQNVTQGDTIDFVVGVGSDGSDHEDVTGLSATIVAVPEPSTVGLVGAALGCLLSLRFLKRK